MHKQNCDTCKNYEPKVDPLAEFENAVDNRPLVKVWSIDKTGRDLPNTPYSFRGQPDWKRIKRENKDAEAIVAHCLSGDVSIHDEDDIKLDKDYYVFKGDDYTGRYFHEDNPVPAIRAEIKKRNKPKFKVGDIVVLLISDIYNNSLAKITRIDSYKGHTRAYITALDNSYKFCVYQPEIRLATRSDFIVRRNGHEWLVLDRCILRW